MDEVIIESDAKAEEIFAEFVGKNPEVVVERSSFHDGGELISLIITKLPAIIQATTALIAVLRSKKIAFRMLKNGKEIKELDSMD